MKVDEAQVHEARGTCTFSKQALLNEHVVKHVLREGSELWEQVIDQRLLQNARTEYQERGHAGGTQCQVLARNYELQLSDSLCQVCADNRWHCHSVQVSRYDEVVIAQDIEAWPWHSRMFIVASAHVRNGSFEAYKLLTGFRPWPSLDERAYRRKAMERVRERDRLYARRRLAVHDA